MKTPLLTPLLIIPDDITTYPEQRRYRFILEYMLDEGLSCPDLSDSRPCMDVPRCIPYRFQLTEWSACLFGNYSDKCGHGFRTRGIYARLPLASRYCRPLYANLCRYPWKEGCLEAGCY